VDAAPAFAHGLSQTGSTRSGGAASQLAAAVVCEMLRAGDLDAHLARTARPALQRRHAKALAAVRELLVRPFGVHVREAGKGEGREGDSRDGEDDAAQKQPVYGGYFLWLTLRSDGPTAEAIAARAKEQENLVIGPGPRFEVYGDQESVQFKYNIRLCFSWEDEEVVVEGIERLARVMHEMYNEKGADQQAYSKESADRVGLVSDEAK
jgi:DNA-binding transcriptional MocR family regulator